MDLLLTSDGISAPAIRDALEDLLGKPISESSALVVPTGIHPFPGGTGAAARLIRGEVQSPLCELGWASLGLLELTALPSIAADAWIPTLRETDALLVWGGDPLFLAYWMHRTGLVELLPTLARTVYVGVSAGSMAATALIGETYTEPPDCSHDELSAEEVVLAGGLRRRFATGRGAGLVDVSVIPHYEHPDHPDASPANAAVWASKLPGPTYAIDDRTALVVRGGAVEVVGDGRWERFG